MYILPSISLPSDYEVRSVIPVVLAVAVLFELTTVHQVNSMLKKRVIAQPWIYATGYSYV